MTTLSHPKNLRESLARYNQLHLLQFESQLSEQQRDNLYSQLSSIDWVQLAKLTSSQDKVVDWHALARRAQPPPAIKLQAVNSTVRDEATQIGQQALREGKVGFILVAGGQGTRLGFDQPKGLYPIGPLSGRTLFQMHTDRLLGMCRRFGVTIPMYVMTSPATDAPTRLYFKEEHNLGLDQSQLQIFCQGMMPAVDSISGQVLLSSMDSVALSPDGHGGLVSALDRSGILNDAAQRGIDYFYYAQIDNPLAKVCQPDLIGHHILARSQMSTQVVQKRFAEEKVGNVVSIDGRVQIIEYSDLPLDIAQDKNGDGSLKFWAGNIAIHVFDRSFLDSVVSTADGLPFHRAHKKVGYVDATGKYVEPDSPNATKFERFVFDLLPMAERSIAVEDSAAEVFAPVKNANGQSMDTPAHTQAALLAQHRRWLESSGCSLVGDVRVEISPLWAVDEVEVAQRLAKSPLSFQADTFLR